MKKITLFLVGLLILTSCVGRKQIEKQLNSGNYDQAISNALKKLEHNKDKKRKQDFIVMLQDAFYKVVTENHNSISHLKKDGNPEQFETIYNLYLDLEDRQRAIKAVMPLYIDGKLVELKFNDYSNAIVNYKQKLSNYKYNEALTLLNTNDKLKNRIAYQLFNEVETINPNYKDTRQLIEVAKHQGTDYVIVGIVNNTNQLIPNRLQNELLNFDTYGLNDFWTVYHVSPANNIDYKYEMLLQLQRINISPERITETQLLRKKNIVDGWEYVLDTNGNVVKDSLGNDIKQDKIITAKARFFEYNQLKSTQIIARVVYNNLKQNQVIRSFPINSEFIFDNIYANVKGDERALTAEDINLLKNRRLRFPSNEQMVYDTGEDLKLQLKSIIRRYNFRS
ncbi:hypothetical protein [Lacinutrix sp. 5H-3-7-4]|uniref:hypothetical protein n=1 Tax=Lacinutrix sp. (strain 5H-3-7-4) TaxID=983544 RepID=UPI00020A3BDA|nr:hypothetical protein [Lacinutrix sp. 5H-3-7-4]AEH02770.1 hypothetical protein Lacal_2932 [Lacinutrix sp. 5H-3-7-4]